MWTARVFTLYPELFPGPLGVGLYKKAIDKKIWSLEVVNIRDYATDKHKTVDDTPFGGGSGMLMRADIIANSLDKKIWSIITVNIRDSADDKHKTVDDTPFGGGSGMIIKPDVIAKSIDKNTNKKEKIIYLSPKGKVFNQNIAKKLSKEKTINLICGHFEGIDQRFLETRNVEEISLGDYILSGGETAAYVLLDSIVRLLPGVLGNEMSKTDESFENGLLEYPQYTKPQKWEGKNVPDVLLSGDHVRIKDWRLSQSEAITRRRRPDLWEKYKRKN